MVVELREALAGQTQRVTELEQAMDALLRRLLRKPHDDWPANQPGLFPEMQSPELTPEPLAAARSSCATRTGGDGGNRPREEKEQGAWPTLAGRVAQVAALAAARACSDRSRAFMSLLRPAAPQDRRANQSATRIHSCQAGVRAARSVHLLLPALPRAHRDHAQAAAAHRPRPGRSRPAGAGDGQQVRRLFASVSSGIDPHARRPVPGPLNLV